MKKILFIAAIAATCFVSCTMNEIVENPDRAQAIGFSTFVGNNAQTRSTVMENSVALAENGGFGVFAYMHTSEWANHTVSDNPDFMNNVQVTGKVETATDGGAKSVSAWEYAPVLYWPTTNDTKVSFFAYAPYNQTNGGGETATSIATDGNITFTLGDIDSQIDLIYANAINQTKDSDNGTNKTKTGEVNFTFAHALSRIGFKVKADIDENTTITVNSITIGAQTTANCKGFYTTGKFNLFKLGDATTGGWTNVATSGEDPTTKSFVLNRTVSEGTGNFAVIGTADNPGVIIGSTDAKMELAQLNNNASYLMVRPQTFAANTLEITVAYEIASKKDASDTNPTTFTNTVTKTLAATFAQGKAYSINLDLTPEAVVFTVVDNFTWDTSNGDITF